MKKVKITYEWWDLVLEIDSKPETMEVMKEQLLFWLGGEERINDEDGDIENAYLKMLAQEMIAETMQCNKSGILRYFANTEGYAPLDGKFGVKLVSVDNWMFYANEFEIEKM